jgi:hypothetical protein
MKAVSKIRYFKPWVSILSRINEGINEGLTDPSVFKDFKNIKFFQVKLGVRVYDDLLADGSFNRCDQVVFLPVKQLGNFGIDLDR